MGTGLSSTNGARAVPDVAWEADPQTGVRVAVYDSSTGTSTFFIVGGTSVGSPSWAGSTALLIQKAGTKLGDLAPSLYSVYNNPTEYAKAFHDITVGDDAFDTATTGWDKTTGLGSPNLGELAELRCSLRSPFSRGNEQAKLESHIELCLWIRGHDKRDRQGWDKRSDKRNGTCKHYSNSDLRSRSNKPPTVVQPYFSDMDRVVHHTIQGSRWRVVLDYFGKERLCLRQRIYNVFSWGWTDSLPSVL